MKRSWSSLAAARGRLSGVEEGGLRDGEEARLCRCWFSSG